MHINDQGASTVHQDDESGRVVRAFTGIMLTAIAEGRTTAQAPFGLRGRRGSGQWEAERSWLLGPLCEKANVTVLQR